MIPKLLLISSFFESPFHSNRAPYNEQLFILLKDSFDIKIIRPIAWTDIVRSSNKVRKKEYFDSIWNSIPIQYPTYYFAPKLSLKYNGLLYLLSIYRTFKNLSYIPDIFYTTWAYPDAYAAMLLAKKYNKKYILRVHGSDINDLIFRKSIQGKVIKVLNNAAVIISPSMALKKKMLKLKISEKKIRVIYSGIDKKKFYFLEKKLCEEQLSLEIGKRRILYIGSLKEAKGVIDLLKAIRLLKDELHDFEALFIGEGEDYNIMKHFIAEHKLQKFVKIIGAVNHDRLNLWINSSNCVCLPSYSEGLPNVLLEALACKTNIVASNVGGIPEILKNASDYLITPGNIIQLKDKLELALSGNMKPVEPAITIETYNEISEKITQIINRELKDPYV